MRAKVGLEKVSETDNGEEAFVVVYAERDARIGYHFTTSGELTEHEVRHFFRDGRHLREDVDAMFQIARQVFDDRTKTGEAADVRIATNPSRLASN